MADQLVLAPLVSPTRPLLWAPYNVRSDGVLSLSSAGAQVPSASSVECRSPSAMVEDTAGAVFLFATARGNLLDILTVENGIPRPVKPGEALSTPVAPDTFDVTV